MKHLITTCLVGLMLATTLPGSAIAAEAPRELSTTIASDESAPIFRRGKARQPRERRFDKAPAESNHRRNMRLQRRNGVGMNDGRSLLTVKPALS